MRKEAAAILGNLNIDIDPDTIVGDLPVSKQADGGNRKGALHQCQDPNYGRTDVGVDLERDRRPVRNHP